MSLFHHHQWEDISCTYTDPVKNFEYPSHVGQSNVNMLNGWLMGVTNIVQKCKDCGKVRSYSFVGKGTS